MSGSQIKPPALPEVSDDFTVNHLMSEVRPAMEQRLQITLGHYDIDYESVMGAFSEAADSSVKTGDPVFVVFHDGTH